MKQQRRKSAKALGLETFCAAIDEIYESAFDLDRWPMTMARIASILNGHRALMFVPDMAGRSFWASHDVSPDMMAGYEEHYRDIDTWTHRCARYLTATGSTILGEMVVPEREYARSEFWNDFSRPADIYRVACVAVEIPEHSPTSGTLLSVFRPHGSEEFDPSALAFLHAIQPHVLRSLKLGRLIAQQSSERMHFQAMLASVPNPVLAVTKDARVVYANPAAESLLRDNDGLTTRSSQLVAASSSQHAKLTLAIARAARQIPTTGEERGSTLRLSRPSRAGE